MQQADDEIDDGGFGPGDALRWVAADGGADDGEDARTDDGADAEGGERDGAEGLFERVLGALGVGDELVDGFCGEDLACQGFASSVQIYWVVSIVSAGVDLWREKTNGERRWTPLAVDVAG